MKVQRTKKHGELVVRVVVPLLVEQVVRGVALRRGEPLSDAELVSTLEGAIIAALTELASDTKARAES